jgi:hypothetical protein
MSMAWLVFGAVGAVPTAGLWWMYLGQVRMEEPAGTHGRNVVHS